MHNMISRSLMGATLLLFIGHSTVYAQTKKSDAKPKSSEIEDRSSDKLDIQKLEQQYWSAKDDDFTVVQNRAYTKAKRFSLGLSYGNIINDSFTQGNVTGLTAGYYISERWGFEYNHMTSNLKRNDTTTYFQDRFAASPDFNTMTGVDTVSAVFVPFYAKMSLMEKMIIYFDMSIGFGVGVTKYNKETSIGSQEGSATHTELDISQHFFINKNIAFRFSVKNQFSQQDRLQYAVQTGQTTATPINSTSVQNTQMLLGITYFH